MSLLLKTKVAPFPKKQLILSEKVTPSEEVEKGTNILNNVEEPVLMTHEKYLDNFQGKYTASTGWFNLDNEWLKRKVSTLEPEFY